MRKQRRLAALILFALLALVLFASSAYLVSASGHCCVRMNCEICKNVLNIKALLRAMTVLAAFALAFIALLFARGFAVSGGKKPLGGGLTLVGWKVRLNN